MRKLVAGMGFMVVVLSFSTAARAQGYGMAGCGLGALLFGNDNSKLMQILASTTNNILIPQTFAITSGTSNCVAGGVVKAEREQAAFAEMNFQDLKRNMATGGGEYLASFSTLLGCEDSAKPKFFKMTQTRYESILPATSTTPIGMLSALKREIKADPGLANSCTDERAVARSQQKSAPPTNVAMSKAPAATK